MVMAVCMAAQKFLPALLYGSSEVMAKAYGNGGEFLKRSALAVQSSIRGCAVGATVEASGRFTP
jgi:hypothetical protein